MRPIRSLKTGGLTYQISLQVSLRFADLYVEAGYF